MSHGLDLNRQVLQQWAELFPQLPLPTNWQKFQDEHLAQAMQVQEQMPWLADLLSGNASASLKLAAIEQKLPTQADFAAHKQAQAQAARDAEEAALKALSGQADQMRRDRVGEKRFEAEQQLEQQRQASLQQQQEATREFEQRMARAAR